MQSQPRIFPPAAYLIAVCCPFVAQVLLAQLLFRADPVYLNHVLPQFVFRPDIYPDYHYYVAMASGHYAGVTEPFAGRVLGPALAGGLSHLTGWPAQISLMLVCAVAWALIGIPAACLFHREKLPLRWAVALSSVPFPLIGAGYFLVPDGLSVLLTLIFLAGWGARKNIAAAGAGLLLVLARSTAALGSVLWLFSRRKPALQDIALPVLGLVSGVIVKRMFFDHGAQNAHGLNPILYYLAKVPVNFLGNVFGFHPYLNTEGWCTRPLVSFAMPAVKALGQIRQVGLCPFDPQPIVTTLLCFLFIFGLFPLIVLKAWRTAQDGGQRWQVIVFLLLFLLAPGFGLGIPRLFVEAFPFFLAVCAFAVRTAGLENSQTWLRRVWVYNGMSWLALVFRVFLYPPPGT